MEEFQKYFFQTTFYHHFQDKNINFRYISHFEYVNHACISHILCVKGGITPRLPLLTWGLCRKLSSARHSYQGERGTRMTNDSLRLKYLSLMLHFLFLLQNMSLVSNDLGKMKDTSVTMYCLTLRKVFLLFLSCYAKHC